MHEFDISYLHNPPVTKLSPPITTLSAVLPISKLSWEDFERLCVSIIQKKYGIYDVEIFGRKGQKQEGIDIYVRNTSGKYLTYQCKNIEKLTPSIIETIIETFEKGTWVSKSEEFYLCTSFSFCDTKLLSTWESLKIKLSLRNIQLRKWDLETLSNELKNYPDIIYRFFGKQWLENFLGKEAVKEVNKIYKLDAIEFSTLREQLNTCYTNIFDTIDPGFLNLGTGRSTFSIIDRFIVPHIFKEDSKPPFLSSSPRLDKTINHELSKDLSTDSMKSMPSELIKNKEKKIQNDDCQMQQSNYAPIRVSIESEIIKSRKTLILGDAGAGKSSLLRFIILDILSHKHKLMEISKHWAKLIPVWLPFAYITKNLVSNQNLNLLDILELWFKSQNNNELFPLVKDAFYDTRLLLFVDGIDEYFNADTAHLALTRIESIINNHNIPVIYTGRPFGYNILKDSIQIDSILNIAPFSTEQIKEYIFRCYKKNSDKTNPQEDQYTKHLTESLVEEIEKSTIIADFATNPLLLNILIHQKMQNITLTIDKNRALEEITSYLISQHPNRRKKQANIVEDSSSRIDLYLSNIFSELALYIQQTSTDGVLTKIDASNFIYKYLNEEIGLTKIDAKTESDKLVNTGANNLGIIIEKSSEEISFIHRQFQEFLAAKCLENDEDDEKVLKTITEFCVDPLWRNLIIFFFGLIPDKKTKKFSSCFQALHIINNHKFVDIFSIDSLKFQIGISLKNAPLDISKSTLGLIIESFENETNPNLKMNLLEIILLGMNNPKISNSIFEFASSYFPNFYWFDDYRINKLNGTLIEKLPVHMLRFLEVCLLNGNDDQKLDASNTLNKFVSNTSVFEFLINIVNIDANLNNRAYALNALLSFDVPRELIEKIENTYRNNKYPLLRFMAIKAKVYLKTQTNDDLLDIFKMVNDLNYRLEETICTVLCNGWGTDIKLKDECLRAVESRHDRKISSGNAWFILIKHFNKEEDVLERIISEIQNEKFPFIGANFRHSIWELISNHYRNHPKLVPIVEDWILKQEHNEVEIASASLISDSNTIKIFLLKEVTTSSFPHWYVMALIKGWGNDFDVKNGLKDYFKSKNARKSMAINFIDKVFSPIDERDEILSILSDILSDTTYDFYNRAVSAMIRIDSNHFKTFFLNKIITVEISNFTRENTFKSYFDLLYPIVNEYYDVKEVFDLIHKDLESQLTFFNIILEKEGIDSEKVKQLLKYSLPLETKYREKIIMTISKNINNYNDYQLFLQMYPLETNEEIRYIAAISLFNYLRFTNPKKIIEIVKPDVFSRGITYETNRRIAFTGFLIIEALNDYFSLIDQNGNFACPEIDIFDSFDRSEYLVFQQLLIHFKYLFSVIGDSAEKLSSRHGSPDKKIFWGMLARHAEESTPAFPFIMEYIDKNADDIKDANIMEFLNRVKPKSPVLKNIALSILGDGQLRGTENQKRASIILGENFSEDISLKDILFNLLEKEHFSFALISLCIGFPDEPLLKEEYSKRFQKTSELWLSPDTAYLFFRFASVSEISNFINRAFSGSRKNLQNFSHICSSPLFLRTSLDTNLVLAISELLLKEQDTSKQISYYNILKKTNRINVNVANWRNEILAEKNLKLNGYDITSDSFQTLYCTLLDI